MAVLSQAGLAFVEGLGLAFSPCILPVLPFILASSAAGGRWRPFLIITGFVISFTVFALASRQLLALTGVSQDMVQKGSFLLLLAFGMVMIVPFLEEKFAAATGGIADRAEWLSNSRLRDSSMGALLAGGLIGLVWTPCAGPILAVALVQVLQANTDFAAALTILSFSMGAAVPMLIIALSGNRFAGFGFIKRHATVMRRAMGWLVVIFAVVGLYGLNIGDLLADSGNTKNVIATGAITDGLEKTYEAPPLDGASEWLNSKPLTMTGLKGKVVLVDFWTYSCVNCIRTLPHIKDWYAKYHDKGFVVIGVHAPEFAFEGQRENVERAIAKYGIGYPVAMDNDFKIWRGFNNRFWPAHYLINREGLVVYTHFGEGNYDITENNIRYLLGISGAAESDAGKIVTTAEQTPETYLGNDRGERESPAEEKNLPPHHWQLSGDWVRKGEYIESAVAGARLKLHFKAAKVFLVMATSDDKPQKVKIYFNGAAYHDNAGDVEGGVVTVSGSRLYQIFTSDKPVDGELTMEAASAGVRLYAFTFEW